jgi:c-di-GMP-binding flagellar brake protein YcgR
MLRYLLPGGVRTTRGMSVDISEGGMAAIVQAGLHVGETVEINLALPVSPLHTLAIVRHVSGSRSGFEFLGLSAEQRHKISHATVAV